MGFRKSEKAIEKAIWSLVHVLGLALAGLTSQGCNPGFEARLVPEKDFISLLSETTDSHAHVAFATRFVQGYEGETLESFVVLQASVNPADYTFKWFKHGTHFQTTVGNPRLLIPDITLTDSGDYEVRVFKNEEKVFSTSIFISVLETPPEDSAPKIILEPASTVAAIGDTVVLRSIALSSPTASIRWFKNGTELSGQNKPYLILRGLKDMDYGDYWVRFQNSAGQAISEIATVSKTSVSAAPSILLASHQPSGSQVTVTEGERVNFWVRARGGGVLYRWYHNDNLLTDETGRNLGKSSVQADDAGTYRVVAQNAQGQAEYAFQLSVNCRDGRVGPQCVPFTRSCTITNGSGLQTWMDGDYGPCLALSCNAGYFNHGGACKSKTPEESSYAILSGFPQGATDSPLLKVGVSSADSTITTYRYKVGPASETNCLYETGYSGAQALTQPISENVSRFPDGLMRLCIVVGNYLGFWQSFENPTSADWIKKNHPVLARIVNAPTRPDRRALVPLTVTSDDPSAISYIYKVGPASSLNCSSDDGYSEEVPLQTPLMADVSAYVDQWVRVCVLAKDSYGLWQPLHLVTFVNWYRPNCDVNRTITVHEPRINGWYVHGSQGAHYCRTQFGYELWKQNTKTRHHEDFALFNGQTWYRQHYSQEPALSKVTCGPKPGCE